MKLLHIIIALCAPIVIIAQQAPPAPPNAPVELPEVLVTGKELIDVGAGSKQAPSRPPILSSARLDTLNPSEKLPIPRLPARSLPTLKRPFAFFPGYVDASFGALVTPSVAAGYSFEAGGYRIDLDADVESSSGWVENSGYLRSGLNLRSTYLAPDQFIVFGGSTTHVNANAAYRSFNLFARPDAARRDHLHAGAAIDVDGSFEDFSYAASVGYAAHALKTAGFEDVGDQTLRGSMQIDQLGSGLRWGADASVVLRQVRSLDYPFVQLRARGAWSEGSLRVNGTIGPQLAISTRADERFGVGINLNADMRVSQDVSASATLTSGLRPLSFGEMLAVNPYISTTADLDAAYDVIALSTTMHYHPSTRLSLAGSLRMRLTEREPVWQGGANGMFTLQYLAVRRFDAHIDARAMLTARDELRFDALFTQASVVDSAAQPYIPSATLSLTYKRIWTSALSSDVGVVYIGNRWADMAARVSLSGYVDLRARVDYELSSSLSATVRAENILSSTIVLWEGYRERGFFATAGLTWRF